MDTSNNHISVGALRAKRRFLQCARNVQPSRVKPFGPEVAKPIVALTLAEPPGETTHWTGRAMAKVAGVSLSYVQRVWSSHGLQPHRIRTFKLSKDPQFAAKVRDIVGLYVGPPAMPWFCPSMRRARSRRWTVPSQACR